jgi:hypothetical protein
VKVTMLDMLTQWPLLIADFSDSYGIRLAGEYSSMSWAEFVMHASGLLNIDSRLARHFAPEPVTETEQWPDQL